MSITKEAVRLLAKKAKVQQSVEEIALEHADGILVQERIDLPSVCVYVSKDTKIFFTSQWMNDYDTIVTRKKRYGAIEFSINRDLSEACDKLRMYVNGIFKAMKIKDNSILCLEISYLPTSGNYAPYGVSYKEMHTKGYEFVITRSAVVKENGSINDIQSEEEFESIVKNISETFLLRKDYSIHELSSMADLANREYISDMPDAIYFRFISNTYECMPNSWKKLSLNSSVHQIRPRRSTLFKAYYFILSDFTRAYTEGMAKGDLEWVRAQYAGDYIRRVGEVALVYFRGLDMQVLKDNKIEPRLLRPQDQYSYRSDINYNYINNEELKGMLRSSEMYRCIYTLLMVALRFVKDKEKVGDYLSETELDKLNAIIVDLHKRHDIAG